MTFVDNQQIIFREVVDQTERTAAGRTPVEIAGVVFDPRTVAQLFNHLQIVFDPLFESPGLYRTTGLFENLALFTQIELNLPNRLFDPLFGRDEQIGRIDLDPFLTIDPLPGRRVDHIDHLDLVVIRNDPIADITIGGINIHRIAIHPECPGPEIGFAARIQRIDQGIQQLVAADDIPHMQFDGGGVEIFRIPDPVDARYARDHDHIVPAAEQGRGRTQPHLFDPLVDRQILFDKRIGRGNIGFGLIIVVIGDEILDGIFREEVLELPIELCGQRFVVAHDQGRLIEPGDDIGHGKRFAGTGHAQQGVVFTPTAERFGQPFDGLGLIARRLVFRYEFEIHGAKITDFRQL